MKVLNYESIVVCGLPRSGTTYIGKVLSLNPDTYVVNEPLNPEFGLTSVTGAFPFVGATSTETDFTLESLHEILQQIYYFRGRWRRFPISRGANRSVIRKTAKILFGSRESWQWRVLNTKQKLGLLSKVILKDPFATFMLESLTAEYSSKAVVMVRHPAALFFSYNAQPWEFGITTLVNALELRERYGYDINEQAWYDADTNLAHFIGVVWLMMARYLNQTRHHENILVVRHEDISLEPITTVKQICEHVEIDFTSQMKEFLEVNSRGTQVLSDGKYVHSFRRDSKALVDGWRGKLREEDEFVLQQLTEPEFCNYYGQW